MVLISLEGVKTQALKCLNRSVEEPAPVQDLFQKQGIGTIDYGDIHIASGEAGLQALLYVSKSLQRHIRVFQENRQIQVASRMDGTVHGRAELKNQLNGVAARDLQECLWLQIRHIGLEGTPAEKIVTEHLRLLQNHQVPEIARKLGMSIDDLKEHIEVIRNLDPKPGSRYNPSQSQYVIPDVYIVKVEDQYVAALNEEGLPQLRISPVYRRLLDKAGGESSDETRAYVKDKFRSALWLIKSVDQRQKTIHKVATSIINFQREFLDHGIEYLRPLVLRDVANDIGMHESTVSRVVNNKYMHTPQGVFEMKYFFHSGISSSYGDAVSSVTIKNRIKKIIEGEDPKKPLSDSKIVTILQREGLMLARRTIAKYREELKIPTSN